MEGDQFQELPQKDRNVTGDLHLLFCIAFFVVLLHEIAKYLDIAYRVGTFLTIGSFRFMYICTKLGINRYFEYKSPLQSLVAKVLVDRAYHENIKTKHKNSHPGIFVATYNLFTSLQKHTIISLG